MKKTVRAITLLVSISMICIIFSGCCLSHEWLDATCTEPKTCAICGKTKGEALGHQWCDATYEEARRCSLCGKADGEPLSPESIDICYHHFSIDELTFDISQYEDKDIILDVVKNPANAVVPVKFEISNASVADLYEEDECSVKLVLKSAGEVVVSATCGEASDEVKIIITDLPRAKRSLIISKTKTGTYGSTTEYTYNEDASEATAVTNDSLLGTYTQKYSYNEAGLVTSITTSYNGSSKTEYEYDEDGKLTSSKGVSGGKVPIYWTAEYSDGKVINEIGYYKNGEPAYVHLYTYDTNGNLVTESCDYKLMSEKTDYSYSNGKLYSKEYYSTQMFNGEMELRSTTEYTYDDNGWLLTETKETDEGKSVISYEYDVYGRLIRIMTDNSETSKYEYDDYGNITLETDGDIVTTTVWKIITE